MTFELKYDTLMKTIKEEISREGAQAYSKDGASLYDAIKWLSRDDDKSQRIMAEVLTLIKEQCNRFICCAEMTRATGETEYTSLEFTLETTQRRVSGREESIKTMLRSLTINLFLHKYFVAKNQTELATKYDGLAAADIKSLTNILYTKQPPVYPA